MPKKQKIEDIETKEVVGSVVEDIEKKEVKPKNDITIKRSCKVLFKANGFLYVKFDLDHSIRFPYTKEEYPEVVNIAYIGVLGKPDFKVIDIEVD